jgi:hypothetical protein
VREHTHWGDTQLKIHMARLVELEYVLTHRGGRGQSFEYELLYDGTSDDARHLSGLINVDELRVQCGAQHYDAKWSGQNDHRSGSGRGAVGPQSGGGRGVESHFNLDKTNLKTTAAIKAEKLHGTRTNGHAASYVVESSVAP